MSYIFTQNIRFTKHAIEKFRILARHKFIITKEKVMEVAVNPDLIDYSRSPLLIAQKKIDRTRALRVVYKEIQYTKLIITFYPVNLRRIRK